MKRQKIAAREIYALDISERVLQHHKDLLNEADQMRLLNQIPITGSSRPGLFRTLLITLGSGLITIGIRLQEAGKQKSAKEVFTLQNLDDL